MQHPLFFIPGRNRLQKCLHHAPRLHSPQRPVGKESLCLLCLPSPLLPTVPGRGGTDARLLLELLYPAGHPAMPPLRQHKQGKPYFTQGEPLLLPHPHHGLLRVISSCGGIGRGAAGACRAARSGGKGAVSREYALWRQARDPTPCLCLYTGDGLRGYPNHLSFDPSGPTLDSGSLHFGCGPGKIMWSPCARRSRLRRTEIRIFLDSPPSLTGRRKSLYWVPDGCVMLVFSEVIWYGILDLS